MFVLIAIGTTRRLRGAVVRRHRDILKRGRKSRQPACPVKNGPGGRLRSVLAREWYSESGGLRPDLDVLFIPIVVEDLISRTNAFSGVPVMVVGGLFRQVHGAAQRPRE